MILSEPGLDTILKIIWYILTIFMLYSISLKYKTIFEKITHILLIMLFIVTAYLVGSLERSEIWKDSKFI